MKKKKKKNTAMSSLKTSSLLLELFSYPLCHNLSSYKLFDCYLFLPLHLACFGHQIRHKISPFLNPEEEWKTFFAIV